MKFKVLLLLIAVLGLTLSAAGQTSRGTVTGTVTDPSGAVVTGATVELTNKGTNQTRTSTTNDAGLYRFDAVDVGAYDLTVKAQGFKVLTTTGVRVQANQTATIDTPLEIGTESVVVDVTATGGELLQKNEPVLGGNFETRQVTQLPTAGSNPYNLAVLLPGVTVPTGGGASFGNASQFAINGQRPRGNNYLIDGTENNDISVTGPATQINNEDAIAEVSVQTGLFSAEFGRAGGGVFNLVTKSGTNDYHGSLKELFQSERFNAITNTNRINNPTAVRPPVFTENTFGGTIGGPLPLPRFGEGGSPLISGKDKTFFFFALQFDRFRSTANFGPFTVPTAAGAARLRQLFPVGTNPRVDLYLNSFANAGIVGVTNKTQIALGNDPATGVNRGSIEFGRIGVPLSSISNDRQYVARVDHVFNPRQNLAVRYTDDNNINSPNGFDAPGFFSDFTGNSRNLLGTLISTFGSSITNELRSSFGQINFIFPVSDRASATATTQQNLSINGVAGIGVATNIPQFRKAKNYELQDTVSKVYDKHTFRFGVEYLKQVAQQVPPFNARGSFVFQSGGGFTSFANFIDNFSGGGGSANITFGDPLYHPNLFRQSYFFQDTYKTTPNLTLTLGLRYENFGQPANSAFKFPAFAGFDPANFLVPNKVKRDNNNFGPIVGFSYSPAFKSGFAGTLFGNGRSVIRGGYQVSYDTFFNNLLSNIASDSPNLINTSTTAPSTGRGLANFFPTALPTTARAATPLDQQTSVFNPNIRNPYTQRFSLGFQRELPRKFETEVSYVGSLGRKLFVTEDLNPRINGGARRFPALGIRRYRTSGANSNYNSMQARLNKRFSRGLTFGASYTWSKFIDQTSEVFNTGSSGSALASIPAFQGGLRLDRAVSDYDRPHRFVLNYVYDLPGPKEGALGVLFGGFQLAGIYQIQSGAPFTILNGLDRSGDGLATNDRPDIGNPNAPHSTRAQIDTRTTGACSTGLLNPDTNSCVTRNDVYVVQAAANSGVGPATIGRNTERSNIVNSLDMSLFKNFRLSERMKIEYRLEAFNVLNHPQFTGVPGRDVTNTPAGSFFNYNLLNGGGRTARMGLKLLF